MKKTALVSVVIATLLASNVLACQYTCPTGTYSVVNYNTTSVINNYGGVVNYNSNSGGGYQVNTAYDCSYEASYTEYNNSYCHLCGLTWDACKCYDYQEEYDYEYSYSYCGSDYSGGCSYSGDCSDSYTGEDYGYSYQECGWQMAHWANLRDAGGNVIGCVGQGASVEVIGQCEDNPSRTLVYDYSTGCYGTVASVYLYGGSAWEYEHPAEWGVYDCSYSEDYVDCNVASAYQEEKVYTCYDETTPWAAGGYCNTEIYNDCGYYEEYGSGSDQCYCPDDDAEYYISVDVEADTINLVNNGVIIISGSCTCASGYSGQELCFSDQRCAGIWNTCSAGFYEQACEYMTSGCKVSCH